MKYIYLPIEVKSRELDSKVLLAGELLSRQPGVTVVIGQQNVLYQNASHAPVGTWLFLRANLISATNMRYVKSHGHKIALLDEEFLSVYALDCIRNNTVPQIGPFVDVAMCQGVRVHAAYQQMGIFKNVVTTGNPRSVLLNRDVAEGIYKEELESIRGAYPQPFILYNTNNAGVNYVKGVEEYRSLCRQIGADSNIDAELSSDTVRMNVMKHHIQQDNARSELNQVVRPHPSEAYEEWARLREKLPFPNKCTVQGNTGVTPYIPWLIAAETVITTACTTGMEAHLLGKRSITPTLQHYRNSDHDNWVQQKHWERDPEMSDVISYRNVSHVQVATALLDFTTGHSPQPWSFYPPTREYQKKFTLNTTELAKKFNTVLNPLINNRPKLTIQQIEDGVFVVTR